MANAGDKQHKANLSFALWQSKYTYFLFENSIIELYEFPFEEGWSILLNTFVMAKCPFVLINVTNRNPCNHFHFVKFASETTVTKIYAEMMLLSNESSVMDCHVSIISFTWFRLNENHL